MKSLGAVLQVVIQANQSTGSSMLKNTKKQTRCPYCSTVYNVSINQLTVSKGWVRCADCRLVFNAVEHLYIKSHFVFNNNASEQQRYHNEDIRAFFHKKAESAQMNLLEYLNESKNSSQRQINEQTHKSSQYKNLFLEYRLFILLFVMAGCALILKQFTPYLL